MKNSIINIKQSILHNSLTSTIRCTKLNLNILKLLFKEGLITHYKKVVKKKNVLYRIFLRYYGSNNIITDIKNLYKSRKNFTYSNKKKYNLKQSVLLSNSNGLNMQFNKKNYSIGGKPFFFINC